MKFKWSAIILLMFVLGTGCRSMRDLSRMLRDLDRALIGRDSEALLRLSNSDLATRLTENPDEMDAIFDHYVNKGKNAPLIEVPWIDEDQNGQNDNGDTAIEQVYRLLLDLQNQNQMTFEIHCVLVKSTDRHCRLEEVSVQSRRYTRF